MAAINPLISVVVILAALYLGYLGATTEDLLYRVRQSVKAVYALQKIPQQRIENFLGAYEMFEMDQFTGTPAQMKLVKDYYETLNHLCAIGNYEKMYLPPLIDPTKDTYSNQKLYEKRMAERLNIGPGAHALDIGCGRGRIAHLVASETGANVTGINIDRDQLESATAFAQSSSVSKQLRFVEANYNEPLPFPDNHFDAVYYVQVIGGYGTNLKKLFREVHRVLKPGGRAAFEDYIVLPKYDKTNAHHRKFVQASKAVLGVVHYYSDKEFQDALDEAGLKTLFRRNGSSFEQARLLERDRDFFLPLTRFVGMLKFWGVIPKHFSDMLERMTKGTDDCIEAHKIGLVTGDIETLVEKPL